MRLRLLRLAFPALGLTLAGCAGYQPAPLPHSAALAPALPSPGPFTMAQAAAMAVARDPDLVAARAQQGVAGAQLLAAGMPPDPSISGGFAALLGGPAAMPAISGSLMQDVSALITYAPDKAAAKAGLAQVNAGILWQEWQVAARAEQLCVAITGEQAMLASLAAEARALERLNTQIQAQVAAHNLTLTESAASATALATDSVALDSGEQTLAQDQAALDGLLGLAPGVSVPLLRPAVPPVPAAVAEQAIATLPERRPDLIALRYGYTAAEQKLRAAIWSQFLPLSLGAAGGRDTSGVLSAGPQVTLTLPLFNRNRPAIAAAKATRAALHAQYAASLATAVADVRTLQQSIALLQRQSAQAEAAAAQARAAAAQAHNAFSAGALEARAETDLIATAGARTREAIALRMQLETAELSLATLLGLGLPPISPEPAAS